MFTIARVPTPLVADTNHISPRISHTSNPSSHPRCVSQSVATVASCLVCWSTSFSWPSPSIAPTRASPSLFGSPFSSRSCWLSSFLSLSVRVHASFLCFFQCLTCVRVTALGHLRYEPARRGSNSYIVPLSDEEIELYHIGSSPLSTIDEDPSEEEMYRRHLAERPLPPEPARRRRSGRSSPFPTLISPLSDPFVEQDARLPTQNGRNTIRLVPESSRKSDPVLICVCTLLTEHQVASRV